MDTLEKLLLVVVGWLLGLLGPAIVDHIRRQRENKLGRAAILAELHNVGGVLAVAVHAVRMQDGNIDREHLQWLKDCVDSGERSADFSKWKASLATQLEWSDAEIASYAALGKKKDGKSSVMQKYPVPLLDSRVSALWSFDTDFQLRLLEIRQLMHRLDDLVERSRKLQDMTFMNLSDFNRPLVEGNIEQTATFYGQTAKRVVDKIAALNAK